MTVYANGVDFAFGNGVTVAQLKDAGVQFVCRYLSGGNSKDISASELDNYLTGGINVVLNWETGGQMPGYAQGVADAQGAQAEVNSLAAQVSAHSAAILAAPIIFSADFDPDGYESAILDYMNGVVSVLGKKRSGIYGGKAALDAVDGVVTYYWQTTAWSGGQLSTLAQIYQYEYNYYVGPCEADKDQALSPNYGYIGASAPAPAPSGQHWTTSPLVEDGDTGTIVQVVQYLLNDAGADLTVDGNFGPDTLAAVKSFQTAHGISATGQIHGYTWPYLVPTVQDGNTGEAVEAVQLSLNTVDDAGLTLDGDFGPATLAAVQFFQDHKSLTVDGIVGQNTWNALVNAVA